MTTKCIIPECPHVSWIWDGTASQYCAEHVCRKGTCLERDGACPVHNAPPAVAIAEEPTHAEWRGGQYTREQWLTEMVGVILDLYADAAKKADPFAAFTPPKIRVSCGWPGVAPGGHVACVKGVCYDAAGSGDGHFEIFVSPMLDDAYEVLATLAHEVTHAIAGVSANHGDVFVATGKTIGMEGAAEQLLPGPGLETYLRMLLSLSTTPAYPHAGLRPPPPDALPPAPPAKPQETRLLKGECPTCGYVIRVTMKWASRGMPICPFDNVPFALVTKPSEATS